jgi:hypothetical protein
MLILWSLWHYLGWFIPSLNFDFLASTKLCLSMSHSHWIEHIPFHQAFHKLHTILFHSLSQLWSYPSSDSIKRKFLQEESLPNKRRILEKIEKGKKWGQRSKGKQVEPHLPIQGHEKLHEKQREDEKFKTSGRDLHKGNWKWRSHFPIVQNPICGLIRTHISFSFALSSNPWFFLLSPTH